MPYTVTILNHLTSVSTDYTLEAHDQSAACEKAFQQAIRDNKDVQPGLLVVIGIQAEVQEVE